MSRINDVKHEAIHEFVYYNKEIIKYEDATIGLAGNTLQYGGTVFAGIRGFRYDDGSYGIFRLKDHHKRLMNACKIMNFGYYIEYDKFEAVLKELIFKNEIKGNFYIRPFVFCDQGKIGPKIKALDFDLAIYTMDMDNYAEPKDLDLMISSYRKYSDAAISTKAKVGGAYVNSMLANDEAISNGYDDALVLNEFNRLAEASVANVITMQRGEVLVVEPSEGCLEGITLRTCIEILQDKGYKLRYTSFDRSSIYTVDEMCLTGTAMQIAAVGSVDRRKFDVVQGELYQVLNHELNQINHNQGPYAKKWITVLSK